MDDDLQEVTSRAAYEQALVDEIRMLIDFISAQSDQRLSGIEITSPIQPAGKMSMLDALEQLDMISDALSDTGRRNRIPPAESAFLQMFRDALNRAVAPASGLTVAYTAMVSGPRRGQDTQSRFSLANAAYPLLASAAARLRQFQIFCVILALLCTGFAVREACEVAYGRSLMQSLEQLRAQQAQITQERVRLESGEQPIRRFHDLIECTGANCTQSGDKTNGQPDAPVAIADAQIKVTAYGLCDRADAAASYLKKLKVPVYNGQGDAGTVTIRLSPQERDLCGRDKVLASNFHILHQAMATFCHGWSEARWRPFTSTAATDLECGSTVDGKPQDAEFSLVPTIMIWGNYILPVVFAFIGSLVFILRDLYTKTMTSTLGPRENQLCWIRMVLGLVIGASIGMVYSGGGTSMAGPAQTLVASLSLSASGIAFLAGFGVEAVLKLLQDLVMRVFTVGKQGAS